MKCSEHVNQKNRVDASVSKDMFLKKQPFLKHELGSETLYHVIIENLLNLILSPLGNGK
jgi:hypothetical protein